ncbi:MAG: NAD(P)-dependent oxidoreductase [Gammaproteobacteria bacterium]|nr:NAD(P)-dependent oxidoreductase [Gammaproteobacteria bacterium]
MKKISFLGLGKMGSVMAPLFIQAGHQLTVFNRDKDKTQPLREQGAMIASDPSEASKASEYIFTMLSDDAAAESIFLSKQGLLSVDVKDKLFIDMSTLKPSTVNILAKKVSEASAHFIDAPVSGTVAPAAKGQLLFFCGGAIEQIERARPLLDILSRRIIHAGDIGSGSLLKLVVNLPLAIYWQALAEAISLGSSGDLSDEIMLDAIADSSAALAVLRMKIPVMLGEDVPVAFDMKSMVKDLKSILTTADETGLRLPTTTSALKVYVKAIEDGGMGQDDAVKIMNFMKTLKGVKPH